jgi:hypothetical protein
MPKYRLSIKSVLGLAPVRIGYLLVDDISLGRVVEISLFRGYQKFEYLSFPGGEINLDFVQSIELIED